jgi:hypothetical protein
MLLRDHVIHLVWEERHSRWEQAILAAVPGALLDEAAQRRRDARATHDTFVQLRPLDRRERPSPLSVEQRLQALLRFRGRRGRRDLLGRGSAGQEGQYRAVELGGQRRLSQAQGEQLGEPVLYGGELVGQLVGHLQRDRAHQAISWCIRTAMRSATSSISHSGRAHHR